jgi:hypothetical protein
MPWLQVRVLPRQPNMTPYETQTITAIANGPGLHALESLLNECAGVEERAALNCSDEEQSIRRAHARPRRSSAGKQIFDSDAKHR